MGLRIAVLFSICLLPSLEGQASAMHNFLLVTIGRRRECRFTCELTSFGSSCLCTSFLLLGAQRRFTSLPSATLGRRGGSLVSLPSATFGRRGGSSLTLPSATLGAEEVHL